MTGTYSTTEYRVSVTYERWSEEAREAGETNDKGFVIDNYDWGP